MIPAIGTRGRCRLRYRPGAACQHENLHTWDTNPNRTYPFIVVEAPRDEPGDDPAPWFLIGTDIAVYSSNPEHFGAYFEIVKVFS